jgi:sarcosine oxidase
MMYDAVVVGLGGMGSAALAHLARRRRRVLGLEQFGRAHDRGSSTGQSRIIRMAYYEDPAYVPLLRRAYELWAELEREAQTRLLDRCGILMVGGPASRVLDGALRSAREHRIALDELPAAAVAARYPALRLEPGDRALFEPDAGMVFPEAAIDAHLRVAARHSAELRFQTRVREITGSEGAVALALDDGSVVKTQRLVLCAGPWLGALARQAGLPLQVERAVQVWFTPSSGAYARDRFPAFFLDRDGADPPLYGFPDYGLGVKAALHGGTPAAADTLDRAVSAADIGAVRAALDAFMPGAAAAFRAGKVCMYTLTPDAHFIIDTDPHDARIIIAGGFSGHGYKFCSVVGEIVADLTCDGETRHPIEFLRLGRPALTAAR